MNSDQASSVSRRWMLGTGVAAAALGAGVAWWRLQAQDVAPAAAEDFWRQRFARPDGGEWTMADLRGRPLLVNFWATWCPPCVQELPMIEAFWRQHASNGVQVLALAIDQPSAVRSFIARQSLSMPIALAGLEGTGLAKSLGNASGGLPFSVFFRADGRIYLQKLGQLTQADLDGWLVSGL